MFRMPNLINKHFVTLYIEFQEVKQIRIYQTRRDLFTSNE